MEKGAEYNHVMMHKGESASPDNDLFEFVNNNQSI